MAGLQIPRRSFSASLFRVVARNQSTLRLAPTIAQLFAQPLADSTSSAASTSASVASDDVTVQGWIRSVRRQKRFAFAVVGDGTTDAGLQAVMSDPTLADKLTTGSSVQLIGKLVASPGKGQDRELQVDSVVLVGESDPESYPIQKKELSAEFLRTMPHLRPRRDIYAQVIRERDRMMRGFHDFYQYKNYSKNNFDAFFGHDANLTVSSQLHLEAVTSSFPRTYTIGPCFRAEASATSRHLNEFWMLEAEVAFEDKLDGIMDVVEQSVKAVLPVGFLGPALSLGETSEAVIPAAEPSSAWPRISYAAALSALRHASTNGAQFDHPAPQWGQPIRSEHERWLARDGPIFVTRYPQEVKPFYMRETASTDSSEITQGPTVECFDLLIPRIGELAGGSLREHRLDILERALPTNESDMGWYLDLRRWGTTPHGGFGLGFERLVAWVTGVESVREAIPFPRWAGRWGM
ncbi:asparaginyl-tRNA synthetase [Auriculariales sp. MPI-PUGE-AT-0066]|nr:asparaginyl-tRNA synthetase [Auriculariales sp. MPI-PUGE-AT-0066]